MVCAALATIALLCGAVAGGFHWGAATTRANASEQRHTSLDAKDDDAAEGKGESDEDALAITACREGRSRAPAHG